MYLVQEIIIMFAKTKKMGLLTCINGIEFRGVQVWIWYIFRGEGTLNDQDFLAVMKVCHSEPSFLFISERRSIQTLLESLVNSQSFTHDSIRDLVTWTVKVIINYEYYVHSSSVLNLLHWFSVLQCYEVHVTNYNRCLIITEPNFTQLQTVLLLNMGLYFTSVWSINQAAGENNLLFNESCP